MDIRLTGQKRGLIAVGAVAVALGAGISTGRVSGQSPAQASADEYRQRVLPVLSKNCFTCHSDKMHSANLSLEALSDPKLASEKPEVWQKVLDKLEARQMPPKPRPQLSEGELADVSKWIHGVPGVADGALTASAADPGRVTARRLNRSEYNNTVRDLLGVTLRPADEFPLDDSGYGFDNIGDVLSLSPMLMEKYIKAAQSVARAAVYGEPYAAKPGQLVVLTPKKLQDDSPTRGSETPYALRGTLNAKYHFAVDAEYEFRWRYGNYRGRGKPVGPGRPFATGSDAPIDAPSADDPPPAAAPPSRGRGAGPGPAAAPPAPRPELTEAEKKARDERLRTAFAPLKMTFSIDGVPMATDFVEGDGNYNYSHGENSARVKVKAGDHVLRVSWPELADHPDAFHLVNADGRQELFVDYMRVLGPYNPSTERPAQFRKIFICGEPGKYTPACVNSIITNLITRAYRRPATEEEVKRVMGFVSEVQKRDSAEEAVRLAIEFVLVSPNFLFRVERDQPVEVGRPVASLNPMTGAANVDSSRSYQISDFELASRLSYFLWGSMPDDELFAAAGRKQLHDPAVMNAQVKRMLQDPKSSTLVESFGAQWLNLYLMDRTKPDSEKFLAIDDELLDAMRTETLTFVGAVMHENRSILDFIDGKFTYLNGPLAHYYGIKGVKGEQFQRVDLDGEQRSGIVTQGSILKISSYATRTSPVLRGKWVLDTLLGMAPPPPPDGIPPLIENDLGTTATMRERLAQHRANPTCAVCHNQMDPIGFSLENYDAAGAWREKDGNFPVDASGTLPDGRTLVGAKGLKAILRADAPIFAKNFTEKLMTYALGRGLERSDRVVVQEITADSAREDYKFEPIVMAIVNSRPFRMRTRAGDLQ